jgi:hypothetical protein
LKSVIVVIGPGSMLTGPSTRVGGHDQISLAFLEDHDQLRDHELVFRAANLRFDVDEGRQINDADLYLAVAHQFAVRQQLFVALPRLQLTERIEKQ